MALIRRSLHALRSLAAGRPAWQVVVGALVALPVWAVTIGLVGLLFEVVSRLDDRRVGGSTGAMPAPSLVRWGTAGVVWLLVVALVAPRPMTSSTAPPAQPGPSAPTVAGAPPRPSATTAPAARSAPTPTPAPTPTSRPTPTAEPTEPPFGPTGPTVTARVTRVIDGDTIEVEIGGVLEAVRYIGIDTPETRAPGSPVEWMGPEATEANAALVAGATVVLEKDVRERDDFGRLLRHVWIERDGAWLLVNLALVAQGYAAVSTYPPDVKYVDLLRDVQGEARDQGLGLWGDPPPTPEPTPNPKPKPTKKAKSDADCHPSYDPCLPIVGDLNCPDVRAMGKAPVRVKGPDEYRLDGDSDGLGCD